MYIQSFIYFQKRQSSSDLFVELERFRLLTEKNLTIEKIDKLIPDNSKDNFTSIFGNGMNSFHFKDSPMEKYNDLLRTLIPESIIDGVFTSNSCMSIFGNFIKL